MVQQQKVKSVVTTVNDNLKENLSDSTNSSSSKTKRTRAMGGEKLCSPLVSPKRKYTKKKKEDDNSQNEKSTKTEEVYKKGDLRDLINHRADKKSTQEESARQQNHSNGCEDLLQI